MDKRLALMSGIDIPIEECQIVVHQPTIQEISFIGEAEFFIGVQTLCIHKSMFAKDKNDLSNITNFQVFMTIMTEKEGIEKKRAVQTVNQLFFPSYKVMFTPQAMILRGAENVIIDESNFDFLQEQLSDICCLKTGPMDQQNFNPVNDKAREIAEKLMRGRQRVAAQKGESNTSVFSQYLSILSVGLQMPLTNLLNLTMYQLYDLMERYRLYIGWDIDLKCRLAGGKPDSQPDDWMKNIH